MKTKFKKIAAFFFAVFMMMGIFSLEAFALEEGASEYSYLSKLSFSNDSKGEVPYAMSPKFDGKTFEYTVFVEDNYSAIRARATLSEEAPEGSEIIAKWVNTSGVEKTVKIESGKTGATAISGAITAGTEDYSFTVEAGAGEDIQIYTVNVKRVPSLSKLSVTDKNGNTVRLSSDFAFGKTEYFAEAGTETVTINAVPFDESYSVTYNGSESNVVALSDGENRIEITVKNSEGYEKTYTLTVEKVPSRKVKFSLSPENALVFIKDENQDTVWPNEKGEYELLSGKEYSCAITACGYIGKSETVNVSEDEEIFVTLEKAKETAFTQYESSWPSFGLNSRNNVVIDRPTPLAKDETALYWANKIGTGYDYGATGVPIIVDDYIFCYAGNTIMKIDKMNGEIIQTGVMTGGSSAYAICSLTYAKGLVFVGLNNGTVQAFNAETLESVWIYRDPLKGQPNAQITYSDGYVYTGFWNSETKNANYVCLSVTDEDPENGEEEKIASWTHTQPGGFYWAGAYIEGDYLYIGTDDGASGYQSGYAHLLSINKHTGRVICDVIMPNTGDIRSSITCYEGKLYFTSKGGYFYEAEFNFETGKITGLRFIALENGSGGVPMSTSTPTIYNGRAYIGVSGKGQFSAYSGHNITVIDIESWSIAYSVPTQGYPQTTGTLTTYYEEETGFVYVYFFDNYTPGRLRIVKDKPGVTEPLMTVQETSSGVTYTVGESVFEPTGALAQYCICTPIIDEDGTLYFKNDSSYLFAVGSAVEYIKVTKKPDKLEYKPGEVFEPEGMEVTAYYYNGTSRDITDYVTYSTEPLTEDDKNIMIIYENVGSDEKPYDIVEIIVGDGTLKLYPEKEPVKTKITLNDTVKFDNTVDTPETYFANKAAGGVFYVGIISDIEYDKLEAEVTGYLKAELLEFDPEKYRSIGEKYCVYNEKTGKITENGEGLSYEKALALAKKLNDESKVTFYKVKCEQLVYVAKITVPENYGVSYKSGTYRFTAEKDGVYYSSAVRTVVTDVSIFEYEYLKWCTMSKNLAEVFNENARGYSDYLSYKYGYGKEEYNPPLAEKPTVVSTTAFRAIIGKKLALSCGEGVTVTIREISAMQRGVNFIFKNTTGELDSEKKTTVYSLNFYGKQPIQSDFTVEWNLGVNAYELRASFGIRLEEEDVITYYVTKDGKYFDEFTVDYMTDDIGKNIVLTFENEAGSVLGNYQITTTRPADADSSLSNGEEFNPNTGAPVL